MNHKVDIIGASMCFGQPKLGVDFGPDSIRYAGLVEALETQGMNVDDRGNISGQYKVDPVHHSVKEEAGLLNFEEVKDFNIELAEEVDNSVELGRFPLILGGDHSLSIGSIAGISSYYENMGVIWFDAHGDLNDSGSSPSGNIHGMPLAISCGLGHDSLVNLHHPDVKVKHENVVLIGVRDLDAGEREYIKDNNILTFTATDIKEMGIAEVMKRAVGHLKEREVDGLHLSLDVDALDPIETPGTGTPVDGGMTLLESQVAMSVLYDSDMVTSMDLVEVNPLLDNKNMTAEKAVETASFLFGRKQL
ncbi:arginase [Salinicoccus albus]|uniref:arginase n=1 Tax=Salinicoccus albus TaxID=418756 RepID=UPI00036A4CBC|nr:arginase [Salinicoccus albus]